VKRIYLFPLLLIVRLVGLQAQELPVPFFHRLGKEDGLLSNQIKSICQDAQGFIWLATPKGLQRYDGEHFTTRLRSPLQGRPQPSNDLLRVFTDRRAPRIWFVSQQDAGWFDLVTEQFTTCPIEGKQTGRTMPVYEFFQDSRGEVWLAERTQGLYRFSETAHAFRPFSVWQENYTNVVVAVTEDPQHPGLLYLGGMEGLDVYDSDQNILYTRLNNPLGIKALKRSEFDRGLIALRFDQIGQLWIVRWPPGEKLCYYRFEAAQDRLENYPLKNTLHRHYFIDQNNTVWIGGEKLDYYDRAADVFRRIESVKDRPGGIYFNQVYQMLNDREGNTWLASDQGVYLFNPARRRSLSVAMPPLKTNDPHPYINALLELDDGRLLAASWDHGLYLYDSRLKLLRHFDLTKISKSDHNIFNQLWCGVQARDSTVWLGAQIGGLVRFDPATERFKFYRFLQMAATIRGIAEGPDGQIWLGTQRGWARFDPATERFENLSDTLFLRGKTQRGVLQVLPERDNRCLLGAAGLGLLRTDGQSGRVLRQWTPDSSDTQAISGIGVHGLATYNDSLLAVATTDGAQFFNKNTGHFTNFPKSKSVALGSDVQHLLCEPLSDGGGIWLYADELARFDPATGTYMVFDRRDGLSEGDISAMTRLRDGRIAVATNGVLSLLHPYRNEDAVPPPEVAFTDFKIRGVSLAPLPPAFRSAQKPAPLVLRHDENFLEIGFASLTYLSPGIRYFYQLEGFDEAWVEAGERRFATYTGLPPGKYAFKVRCENRQSRPTLHTSLLRIEIKPPWWRTWPFYSFCILALGGLAYAAHRVRVDRLLEAEKVRERIARDLHDDMGSTLSTIGMLSDLARRNIDAQPGKTAQWIDKIGDSTRQMAEAMEDIIWSVRPDNDTMSKIIARMRTFAGNALESKNIDCHFQIDPAVLNLRPGLEARRDFYLIFKEIIHNAAKYSAADTVGVHLFLKNKTLVLEIQDDGVGFDPENPEIKGSGNGLDNLRKRAANIGAVLEIRSKVKRGTAIALKIPTQKASPAAR
jgi:signal transduction histidine kinase/ligand-binding sensor domain-containing protein